MNTKKVGEMVAADRKRRGLTQNAYAGLIGVTASTIGMIERGQASNITIETAEGVCKVLGRSLDDVFGETTKLSIMAENYRQANKRLKQLQTLAKAKRLKALNLQCELDEINKETAAILAYMEENK